jgi:RNA polymerase sigma-70 factor (ECF subfamily)
VSAAAQERLLDGLVLAIEARDERALLALLSADATWTSDGGGKARAARKQIRGAPRVARFAAGVFRKLAADIAFRRVVVNDEPGYAILHQGQLTAILAIRTDGRRILEVFSILNPDKLHDVEISSR